MKIIAIGKNYQAHINEMGSHQWGDPVVFLKADSSVLPDKNPFILPVFSSQIEYEVEVLVKINKVGKHISAKFAHKYYDEVGLGIDFTARDLQEKLKEQGLPWEISKSFDGSTVLGKFVPKTNFDDLQNLQFSLSKNNEVVQYANTAQMIYTIDDIIAYVSKFFTLKKGDIIFTGTPAGVGAIREGDVLVGYLEGEEMLEVKIK